MNDYLNAKEGGSNYSSFNNIFVDDLVSSDRKLKVALTPASYVSGKGKTERNLMIARSKNTEVELELYHDKSNRFDNKALKVSYNSVEMGYIQKKYSNIDRTSLIDSFCFNVEILSNISLKCINGVYFILKIDVKNSKQSMNKKVNSSNKKDRKILVKKEKIESENLLEKLTESMGWNMKK